MTQNQLAKRANLAQSTVCFLEIGRNSGTKEIFSVAKALECSPEWLLYGSERKKTRSIFEKDLPSETEPLPQPVFRYPLISILQAGHWKETLNPFEPGDGEEFIPSFLCYGAGTFVLRIEDESMQPEFNPGDLVLIDPTLEPRPGDLVVARNGEEQAIFRKFRLRGNDQHGNKIFELKPLNDDFPTYQSSDSVHMEIVGVMVEHHRYRKK